LTFLGEQDTCFLLPNFDRELSVIMSLESGVLTPLFRIVSVEFSVVLWNYWGAAVPFSSSGDLYSHCSTMWKKHIFETIQFVIVGNTLDGDEKKLADARVEVGW